MKKDKQFDLCNFTISANYHTSHNSTFLYNDIINAGLQILIYSGNVDADVSFIYTRD